MKIKQSRGEVAFQVLNYALIILLCVATAYPFWHSLVLSISSRASAMGMGVRFWPSEVDLTAWWMILKPPHMWRGLHNTLVRTVGGTVISLLLTVMTAYPLAKKQFPHRDFFTGLVVFTMLFGGGMIPTYILVKDLHLLNSLWALMLPGAISPFTLIIVRNFFQSLPPELEEAARMDGANDIDVLFRIVLPLSRPVLATITLWFLVGHWNAWFDAVLYLNDRSKLVLQQILREVVILNVPGPSIAVPETGAIAPLPESLKAATTMFVTIPILLVYPFLQRHFAKGIMLGALKG